MIEQDFSQVQGEDDDILWEYANFYHGGPFSESQAPQISIENLFHHSYIASNWTLSGLRGTNYQGLLVRS
jgi:hypothetical protein